MDSEKEDLQRRIAEIKERLESPALGRVGRSAMIAAYARLSAQLAAMLIREERGELP